MADHASRTPRILHPGDYRRTPWKNGGGVTIDIDGEWRAGSEGQWTGMIWRLGRTSIAAPGPFCDLSGYDRAQVVVRGRGLSLTTPDGEIDLREPFRPARYKGEAPISSHLDSGPVEVVNLIGERASVAVDLFAVRAGETKSVVADVCIVYAPDGAASFAFDNDVVALTDDHAARIDAANGAIACREGVLLLALINRR